MNSDPTMNNLANKNGTSEKVLRIGQHPTSTKSRAYPRMGQCKHGISRSHNLHNSGPLLQERQLQEMMRLRVMGIKLLLKAPKGKRRQNQRMYTPSARSEQRTKFNRPAHSVIRDTKRVQFMIPSETQIYPAINNLRFFSQQ